MLFCFLVFYQNGINAVKQVRKCYFSTCHLRIVCIIRAATNDRFHEVYNFLDKYVLFGLKKVRKGGKRTQMCCIVQTPRKKNICIHFFFL